MKPLLFEPKPSESIEISIVGVYRNQKECYDQYIKCENSEDVKYGFIHMKEDGTHIGLMVKTSETVIATVEIDNDELHSNLEDDMDF